MAAAAVFDDRGRVLIAKRPGHLHQGGLWEFPGGKVEPGEGVEAALAREMSEEVGLIVRAARPLIRVPHAYPDRRVLLEIWRVDEFEGNPHGREGQEVRWVEAESLTDYEFPAANLPIVTACRLPDRYLITPEPGPRETWAGFLGQLGRVVETGVRLVQLRAKGLPRDSLEELLPQAIAVAHGRGARLLVNTAEPFPGSAADGLHLPSAALNSIHRRPVPRPGWVAASCHTREDLRKAEEIDCDFVVVSPVQATASHPGAPPIGWDGLLSLTESTRLPVYALGGLGPEEITSAWRYGAQGIAAIRGLWSLG